MTRVLVTGAAGFVGANLVRRLAADGHEVHAWVRPQSNSWRLQPSVEARVHRIDIRDADAVARLVSETRPEWVFHCAAFGAYSWQRDAALMRAVNVEATAALLAASRRAGVARFVNTGSSSEYGYKDRAAVETDEPEPNSPYAESKLAGTRRCRAEALEHGQAVVTLRLYSVYGPWEEPNRLLPTLLTAALQGTLPPLVAPDTARDFVYVDDVCEAYLQAARHPALEPGAIFNVGTGGQTTIGELVELVRTTFGIPEAPRWGSMPARSWDTTVWCGDITKIRSQLGWEPRCSMAEGIRRMAAWIEQHPDVRARYESALGPR